jgi:hypothetical protein
VAAVAVVVVAAVEGVVVEATAGATVVVAVAAAVVVVAAAVVVVAAGVTAAAGRLEVEGKLPGSVVVVPPRFTPWLAFFAATDFTYSSCRFAT